MFLPLLLLMQTPPPVVLKVDPEKTPATVVARYVAAHNAKDLQALLATVDLDVKLAVLPDQVQLKGKADFASAMRESFAAMPDVKLDVTERMLAGTRVIDHHWTKGLPDGRLVRGITIYEVRNGLIVGMWFAQD